MCQIIDGINIKLRIDLSNIPAVSLFIIAIKITVATDNLTDVYIFWPSNFISHIYSQEIIKSNPKGTTSMHDH